MSYDFTTLSPGDFENLVADLLSRSWGRQLESFKAGKDGGIDLRLTRIDADEGDTVVQCKRYAPHKFAELARSVKLELPKITKLRPRRYVLATSVGLTPQNKEAIFDLLRPWCLSPGDILGPDELNGLLREHPEVEKAHFKLWISSTEVLESVLHAGIFAFTDATIDATRRQISKLVVHNGLTRALDLLHQHHHVLIAGNPGIGKTTLARMLMCHYMGQGFEPLVISRDIEDAWTFVHQARDERRKLFIVYDDFLGQSQFESKRFDKNEDASLMTLLDKVNESPNLRLVLTTREYILEDAKRVHGAFDTRANELVKCAISLEDYTETHRAKMLFNHLYFSELPESRLRKFVQTRVYRNIIKHRHFNPRVVEGISNFANSRAMSDDDYIQYVKGEFENPAKVWAVPFHRQISSIAKHLLVSLWSIGGKAEISFLRKCVALLNPSISPEDLGLHFNDALKQVDGSFVQTGRIPGLKDTVFHIAQFQNPSVEEFIGQLVREEPTWLDRILHAVISFGQIDTLYQAAQEVKSLDTLNPAFWLNLRARARDCEDSTYRVLSTSTSWPDKKRTQLWLVQSTPQSVITRRLLEIEFRAKSADERTHALEGLLLTVSGWSDHMQDSMHGTTAALDTAQLQHWIANDSGWAAESVRDSNRCYRAALLAVLRNPPRSMGMEISALERLTKGCLYAGDAFSDEERSVIAKTARSSVWTSLSLDEKDADEYQYSATELKKIATYLDVDMSKELEMLERRANELKYDEEDDEDSDAEEMRYEIEGDAKDGKNFDRLFRRLLDR